MGDLHECIREFFAKRDRLAEQLGVEILEVGAGRAVTRLRIDERHLNGAGVAHGGALTTLADVAFAAASNSHNALALAININISFMKAVGGGALVAEARELSRRRRTASYEVIIRDESGETVAVFHGLAYIKGEPLVPED
ncbi:MAG: PaaI family thioesterase [Verrucomicrobia bacterium]|nr:PaaI family thioesterase [Verrucomicrobiota bacterium]